ncbi:uncharacterized protein LOC120237961 [Hyaena hyaena]|uniref:uncharacterized protein LOC120237961 n=1 Tax=Hyaena hyaena TaxID=95912 RepID=UPI00192438C5|nr:uncharacterized protein LOC120237961 [Hyaena hyaena]
MREGRGREEAARPAGGQLVASQSGASLHIREQETFIQSPNQTSVAEHGASAGPQALAADRAEHRSKRLRPAVRKEEGVREGGGPLQASSSLPSRTCSSSALPPSQARGSASADSRPGSERVPSECWRTRDTSQRAGRRAGPLGTGRASRGSGRAAGPVGTGPGGTERMSGRWNRERACASPWPPLLAPCTSRAGCPLEQVSGRSGVTAAASPCRLTSRGRDGGNTRVSACPASETSRTRGLQVSICGFAETRGAALDRLLAPPPTSQDHLSKESCRVRLARIPAR